jgi:hypothetical protein
MISKPSFLFARLWRAQARIYGFHLEFSPYLIRGRDDSDGLLPATFAFGDLLFDWLKLVPAKAGIH